MSDESPYPPNEGESKSSRRRKKRGEDAASATATPAATPLPSSLLPGDSDAEPDVTPTYDEAPPSDPPDTLPVETEATTEEVETEESVPIEPQGEEPPLLDTLPEPSLEPVCPTEPAATKATLPTPTGGAPVPINQRGDEFLAALSKTTLIAVYEIGVSSLTELCAKTAKDLLRPKGPLNAEQLQEVEQWLHNNGQQLAKPSEAKRPRPRPAASSNPGSTRHLSPSENTERLRKRTARLKGSR